MTAVKGERRKARIGKGERMKQRTKYLLTRQENESEACHFPQV